MSAEINSIYPIKISDDSVVLNQKFLTFGWGTPLANKANREIQTGQVTVLDRNICPQTFNSRFCAGPSFFGGCQGDDGGAVVFNQTLYGLVDYRSSDYCNEAGAEGHLYVDIVEYREWIESTVDRSSMIMISRALLVLIVGSFIFVL